MSTTMRLEDSTLKVFRQKKIEYQAKHKIILKNDDEFEQILLGIKKNE
jgi:hypothetical protein|tara:strand:- start:451 stop:594 length:144 start_codon:yes stop_codon:yes gene_type:complete